MCTSFWLGLTFFAFSTIHGDKWSFAWLAARLALAKLCHFGCLYSFSLNISIRHWVVRLSFCASLRPANALYSIHLASHSVGFLFPSPTIHICYYYFDHERMMIIIYLFIYFNYTNFVDYRFCRILSCRCSVVVVVKSLWDEWKGGVWRRRANVQRIISLFSYCLFKAQSVFGWMWQKLVNCKRELVNEPPKIEASTDNATY